MDPATRLDQNHELSLREFPYIIRWRDDRCTRCGRCTAVCPVNAIEPAPHVHRRGLLRGQHRPTRRPTREIVHVVRQVTDIDRYCTGCGTCTLVCPNEAIEPEYNPRQQVPHLQEQGRRALPPRRPAQRPDAVDGRPAQVHPHINAHRPGARRRPARVPHPHAAGPQPAAGSAAAQAARRPAGGRQDPRARAGRERPHGARLHPAGARDLPDPHRLA